MSGASQVLASGLCQGRSHQLTVHGSQVINNKYIYIYFFFTVVYSICISFFCWYFLVFFR